MQKTSKKKKFMAEGSSEDNIMADGCVEGDVE
jgi:hypothetical protein